MDDRIVRKKLNNVEEFDVYVRDICWMFNLDVKYKYEYPRMYFTVRLSNGGIVEFNVLHHDKLWNRTAYYFAYELYLHTLFLKMLPVEPRDSEPRVKPSKLPSLRSIKDGTA